MTILWVLTLIAFYSLPFKKYSWWGFLSNLATPQDLCKRIINGPAHSEVFSGILFWLILSTVHGSLSMVWIWLIIGGHRYCSSCVLRFVVLTVKYGIFRGVTPVHHLCFTKVSSYLGHQMSLYLLSKVLAFFLANYKHVFRHLGLRYRLCSLDHNYGYD